jgi:hypothetical protein
MSSISRLNLTGVKCALMLMAPLIFLLLLPISRGMSQEAIIERSCAIYKDESGTPWLCCQYFIYTPEGWVPFSDPEWWYVT